MLWRRSMPGDSVGDVGADFERWIARSSARRPESTSGLTCAMVPSGDIGDMGMAVMLIPICIIRKNGV
jgi:hypothetical protein